MENSLKQRNKARKSRVMRVRKKVRGTREAPRLSVIRSNKHLYAQLIDDDAGVTLKGVGTLTEDFKAFIAQDKTEGMSIPMVSAKYLGEQIAKQAKEIGVDKVVFDRGFRMYHGVIKQFAESARESGLKF